MTPLYLYMIFNLNCFHFLQNIQTNITLAKHIKSKSFHPIMDNWVLLFDFSLYACYLTLVQTGDIVGGRLHSGRVVYRCHKYRSIYCKCILKFPMIRSLAPLNDAQFHEASLAGTLSCNVLIHIIWDGEF